LRKICRIRTATLCETITTLKDQGRVVHGPHGLNLADKTPVSLPDIPIGPAGNGNGKRQHQMPLDLIAEETA
jgi:hypothetical protein